MKTVIATALAFAVPGLAAAHDYILGDLEIIHPRIFETAAKAKAGGGYVTIANEGGTADALIGVDADFPKVKLHRSTEEDGVMRMRHVDEISLPAGEIMDLTPGGYHVMFMGLSEPLEAGDEVPATLRFENAGDLEIMFKVIERTGHMDHDSMQGSDSE